MPEPSPPRSGLRETLPAVALATVWLALVYAPGLYAHGATFLLGRSDLWGYFAPMAYHLDASLARGVWPEWNPHILCGTPFAANPQAAVYYPPHLLRGLLHALMPGGPTPWGAFVSLACMVAAHQLLLAAGTYRFAREGGLCRLSSVAAMLAFLGAAELVFRSVQHWAFIAEAAWLPWLLLYLRRALRAEDFPARVWNLGLAGLIFGLTILIGFPQLTLYLGAFTGLYALGVVYSDRQGLRAVPRAVALVGVLAIIGVLLALPMLYPAAELAAHAPRAKEIGSADTIVDPKLGGLAQDPAGALRILFVYPGSHGLRLLGAVAAMLALCTLRSARPRAVLVWCVLLVAMLDASLGPPWPLATLFAWIAPFRLAEPQRATLFAAFALALLAGHGVDALARPRASRFSARFWATLFAALGAGLLLGLVQWQVLDPDYRVTPLVLLAQAVGVGGVVLAIASAQWRPRAFAMLVLALAAEQALWGATFAEKLVRDDPFPGQLPSARPEPSLANARSAGPPWLENESMFWRDFAMTGYDPLMLGEARQVLCAPRTEHVYNRRISADEVMKENTIGVALLGKLFWIKTTVPPAEPPAKDAVWHMPPQQTDLQILSAGPNEFEVQVGRGLDQEPRWLVFTETSFSTWRAYVDGEAEIKKAYGIFQAVSVPPGQQRVRFVYHSPRITRGALAGALAWATLLAALLWSRRYRSSPII